MHHNRKILFHESILKKLKSKKKYCAFGGINAVKISARILGKAVKKRNVRGDSAILIKLKTTCEQLTHNLCSGQKFYRDPGGHEKDTG
jgi:hypothetical protein